MKEFPQLAIPKTPNYQRRRNNDRYTNEGCLSVDNPPFGDRGYFPLSRTLRELPHGEQKRFPARL